MEDSTQLTELSDNSQHHHHRRHNNNNNNNNNHHYRGRMSVSELGDDECSTDSGCSSGGSTSSSERLSRRDSDELPGRSTMLLRNYRYLERLRATGRSTRSQNRGGGGGGGGGGGVQRSSERTWSPEGARSLPRDGTSPSSYSSSPSDAHSDSDSDFKRLSTTEILRRAFQNLKITSSKWDRAKEKKRAKKSPKRILRSPVSYMYVRGMSGLATQRVPRNGFQQIQPRSCQDLIGLYR